MNRFRNFSRRASKDLDSIVGWLLDHGAAPAAAEQVLAAVLTAAERLADRPALGRRRPDLLPEPFRFWSIARWKLLLVYDASSTPATILRVLNTARDLPPLLTDLQHSPDTPED